MAASYVSIGRSMLRPYSNAPIVGQRQASGDRWSAAKDCGILRN
jgi:hypothetical protein